MSLYLGSRNKASQQRSLSNSAALWLKPAKQCAMTSADSNNQVLELSLGLLMHASHTLAGELWSLEFVF